MSRKFSIYLSHSWHARDVAFNVWVWERLAGRCDLLVDKPASQAEDPPYYVNRLEEAIRRSDIFAAVLTHRNNADAAGSSGDRALHCSAGSLFEIRLAERANRPRLVLYERSTRFRRPDFDQTNARYIAFDRGAELLPEALDRIDIEISSWLDWVDSCRKPRFLDVSDRSLVLLPTAIQKPLLDDLQAAIERAPYGRIELLHCEGRTDSAVVTQVRSAGLLVADVTSDGTREPYAVTHALFIPTIRLASDGASLPWILDGHPGGFQHDLIRMNQNSDWLTTVTDRANAMFRITHPLGMDEGKKYLKSRRYKGVYVFLSHNLKPGSRTILDHLIEFMHDEHIEYYEYYRVNKAGDEWPPKLKAALAKTTLFVGMLADGYEDSDVCLDEWKAADDSQTPIIAFLVNGRTTRTNLTRKHAKTLDGPDPAQNAETIFHQILDQLASGPQAG